MERCTAQAREANPSETLKSNLGGQQHFRISIIDAVIQQQLFSGPDQYQSVSGRGFHMAIADPA
jgi:hypothetical protein